MNETLAQLARKALAEYDDYLADRGKYETPGTPLSSSVLGVLAAIVREVTPDA